MTTATDTSRTAHLPALTVSRVFAASRELVFQAWTAAEHLQHWFCPTGCSLPEADIQCRVGGKFDLCMRSPAGLDHWMRGHYVEIVPHARLVIDITVVSGDGKPLFSALTTVGFEPVKGGTRMEVTQQYTALDPSAGDFTRGAQEGWRQTLDKLEQEVARIVATTPAARSVVHGQFRIERNFDATPAQVYRALTELDAKSQWFRGGADQTILARTMDVRPGGREHVQGRWTSGMVSTFDATYLDVVPDARLVYAYEMHIDTRKISVSLATFELKPNGSGTQLVLTEQGAFLDGYDDAGAREHGTNMLVDQLGAWLRGR